MVLRKWLDLKPGLEFRCFIKKNKLIGISQRHPCDFFPFLGKGNGAILEDIKLFFYNKIYKQFPDENYVFDVYRKSEHNILLLDFNPFGPVTDGLLFEWEELDSWPDGDSASEEVPEPVFRFIETEMGVKPSPYQQHGMPVDMVDLAAGTDPHKLIDFLQMKIQSQQDDSSGEDDSSDDKPEEDMSNVLAKRTDGDSKDIDNSDSKTCTADSATIS
ncbi:cell division cycle protein 123 homolog [Lingula anatina]|uniref:Cell division cycle protein 123 homolog n=1 Tax=Lingula anatina TaxID=7574 RepID=A0A1S3IEX8_LINAN|nr:cell division cycle protein 123 homolog [Lingula anatina]|eukprot:XP_013396820.1 cell division cycle protein 123 homolog [Lingula anatina]